MCYNTKKTMKKYLICYWAERNDEATDLEDFVEADNIMEALRKFTAGKRVLKKVSSISEVANHNYIPDFNYQKQTI